MDILSVSQLDTTTLKGFLISSNGVGDRSWAGFLARGWIMSKQRIVAETQTGILKLWLTFWQHTSLCQITSFLPACDCWSPSQSRLLLLLFFTQLPAQAGRVPVDCLWRAVPRIRVDGVSHVKTRSIGRSWELLCEEIEAVLFAGCLCTPLCFSETQICFLFIWWLSAESLPLSSFERPGYWGRERKRDFWYMFFFHSSSQAFEFGEPQAHLTDTAWCITEGYFKYCRELYGKKKKLVGKKGDIFANVCVSLRFWL